MSVFEVTRQSTGELLAVVPTEPTLETLRAYAYHPENTRLRESRTYSGGFLLLELRDTQNRTIISARESF